MGHSYNPDHPPMGGHVTHTKYPHHPTPPPPHHPLPPTPTTPPTNTRTTTTTNRPALPPAPPTQPHTQPHQTKVYIHARIKIWKTPLFADPGGNRETNIPVSVEIVDLGIQQNTFYARKGESNLSFLRHFYMYVAAYSTAWLYALTKWKPRWKQADTCKVINTFQIFVNLCLKKLPLFSFRKFANPIAKIFLFLGNGYEHVRFGWE